MSTTTTTLGLSVYDDADNVTVKTWRDTINKNSAQSAFGLIDSYASNTNDRLTALEVGRKVYRVFAFQASENNYIATVPELTELTDGIQIQVSFNISGGDDTTVLNINSLGNTLMKKINESGFIVDLSNGEIIAEKIYSFEYMDETFIKMGGFASSEIIISEGIPNHFLKVGDQGSIGISDAYTVDGRIAGDSIGIGGTLAVVDHNIDLSIVTEASAGTYYGLTVDKYGRIISIAAPKTPETGERLLGSDSGALKWITAAPNSLLLEGHSSSYYLAATGKAADSDKLNGQLASYYSISTHNHDANYLGINAKAADSSLLDGSAASSFVNITGAQTISGSKTFSAVPTLSIAPTNANHATRKSYVDDLDASNVKLTGAQTVAGVKTFSSLPTLPTATPTTNQPVRKGYADATYGRPVFLTTPLTSTSWDGDAYSTTAKTLIDLSAVFGVPAGVKAVLVRLIARDSGSPSGFNQLILSPNATTDSAAVQAYLSGVSADIFVSVNGIVPCDANGDIYYQVVASGTDTLDAIIEIWGYWL